MMREKNLFDVCIGRDGRLSGPELSRALIDGLQDGGCNVTDLGAVTSPMVYFATFNTPARSGVVLTASHNPPEYNGLKIVVDQKTWCEDELKALYQRCLHLPAPPQQRGTYQQLDIFPSYLEKLTQGIALKRPLKIVLDCAHGVGSAFAPKVFRALGCEVHALFCTVDGRFPAHTPDTSDPRCYEDLIAAVQKNGADLGIALDGDADRVGVVDDQGTIVWPDRLMMLFAEDLLRKLPGQKIIFDVKCSQQLSQAILQNGGQALMWRTGHSLIKNKMHQEQCLFAGEMSGHLFFKDRWYGVDDGIYTAARLLELLSTSSASLRERLSVYPTTLCTPEIKVAVPEDKKFFIVQQCAQRSSFDDGVVSTIDGLRVDFEDGFGLIRASNTAPVLTVRFEGIDAKALQKIQHRFRVLLQQCCPELNLPF